MELKFKKSNIWENMPHGLKAIHEKKKKEFSGKSGTKTESWSKCVVNQRLL